MRIGKGRRLTSEQEREADRVAEELERYCADLAPGDKIPTHHVLMARFGASERTVLRALANLARVGRIVRRPKVGTIIAETKDVVSPLPVTSSSVRNLIAVTRPDNGFYSKSVEILHTLAREAGMTAMLQPVGSADDESFANSLSVSQDVGYIVIGAALAPLSSAIIASGHRCVCIGEPFDRETLRAPIVHVDNYRGGYLAVDHLIEAGHRRIAVTLLTDTPRGEGYAAAIQKARSRGIDAEAVLVREETLMSWSKSPGAASAYFRSEGAPTAICPWDDSRAIMLVQILLREGVKVPDDVAIVGYDNLPETANLYPSITTVDGHISEQLRAAIRLLTSAKAPSEHTEVIVVPTLVVRESTAGASYRSHP
jgi:LacI family transcriptional regulator